MEYFQCEVVEEISSRSLPLPETLLAFIKHVANYRCNAHEEGQYVALPGIIISLATTISLFCHNRINPTLTMFVIFIMVVMFVTVDRFGQYNQFPALESKPIGLTPKLICFTTVLIFLSLCLSEVIQGIFKNLHSIFVALLIFFLVSVTTLAIDVTVQPEVYCCEFIPLCQ